MRQTAPASQVGCSKWCGLTLTLSFLMVFQAGLASAQTVSYDPKGSSVIISQTASESTREAATELATYLGDITDSTISVKVGDGKTGIAVGTLADFPDLKINQTFLDPQNLHGRENYLLRSHAQGVHVIGTTDVAMPHAVWGLLHELGYRQYLPGPLWEHIPSTLDLRISVDRSESPTFVDRRIFPGGGLFDYDRKDVLAWRRRNRLGTGFAVSYSHVYDKIVKDYKQVFEEHPEYLALIDGKRVPVQGSGNKFCISNPAVRQLAVTWATTYLEKRPDAQGVSMEPSDGMGWCECQPCTEMGSISDRAYGLASQVAAAVNEHFDSPKYVGIYAYGGHSPPPSDNMQVHPRVLVMVAKGFLRGGWTFESLLRNWSGRENLMGVRDYLSVYQWSKDMPGEGRASRRDYPVVALPFMYEQGARLYCGESEGNWGPAGFTYYLTSRVLWNIKEANHADAIFNEYLSNMFGDAAEAMREFYDLIDGNKLPLLSEDLVGRMYRVLGDARAASNDVNVTWRIDHLIYYTRYVEMYRSYQATSDTKLRQVAFEELIRFAWQIAPTYMVHTREVHRILPKYDHKMKVPKEAYYRLPSDRNAWAQNKPLPSDAAVNFLKEGIAANALLPFEPKTFSRDLVPAADRLGLMTTGKLGTFAGGGRGTQLLHTWVDTPRKLQLQAAGGQIAHYRNRGNARIKLFKGDEVTGGDDEMPLSEAAVPPDGTFHRIALSTQEKGLHMIQIQDGGDRTELQWADGQPMTWYADMSTSANYPGTWTLVFYVPRDARTVSGYASANRGHILNADGQSVLDLRKALDGSGFFSVPVEPGQAGRIWQLSRCRDKVMLMTVPPCLARSPAELLLPREVVEADARK